MKSFKNVGIKRDVIDYYKIAAFILNNDMDESQFCEMAGLPPLTVSSIIGFHYREVTLLDLINMAAIMEIPVKDLFL